MKKLVISLIQANRLIYNPKCSRMLMATQNTTSHERWNKFTVSSGYPTPEILSSKDRVLLWPARKNVCWRPTDCISEVSYGMKEDITSLVNRHSWERLSYSLWPPSSKYLHSYSGHVWMWQLDCEESWAPKNWCFWTVVLEKTLESPLDRKEIQPVHPKGDQSWVFFGRTDAKVDSLEKTLMLGGIGGRRRRGRQRMRWLDVSLSELRQLVMDREAWRAAIHEVTKSRTWLSDWTELNWWPF